MRCIQTLDELADLVAPSGPACRLYVRWTADLDRDLASGVSRDELTGVELPGLSANSLAVQPWWGDRSVHTWVARRLYDYRHLRELRGPDTRPWILAGDESGRGPDNEPLLHNCEVVAEVRREVITEAVETVEALPANWGSLRRV